MAEEAGLMTAERSTPPCAIDAAPAQLTTSSPASALASTWTTIAPGMPSSLPKEKTRRARRAKQPEGEGRTSAPAAKADTSGTDMDIPDEAADVPLLPQGPPRHGRRRHHPEGRRERRPRHRRALRRHRAARPLPRAVENAALEMGIQLDAYAKLWGIEGSNLAMNLRKVTREKHDYRAFLRKFARMGEQIRVNDDEFDYVFYTYGLELYGNLPLVEPVEFAEEKRIRDFVIAIDTSASTKDGLVRQFIERTYSILADETRASSRA